MVIFWDCFWCHLSLQHPLEQSAALTLTKALLIYQQTMLLFFFLCCLLCEFLLTLITSDLCLQSPQAFLVKFRRAKAGRLVLHSLIQCLPTLPYLLSLSLSLFFSVHRELHRAGPGRSGRSPAGLVPTAPRQQQAEQHRESCHQFCIKWGSNIYLASDFIFGNYSSFLYTTDQQHTMTLPSFVLVVSP